MHKGAIHLLIGSCTSISIGCNPAKQINLPVTRLEWNWSKLTPIRPNLLGRYWKRCSSSLPVFLSFSPSFLPLHLLSALQQGQLCEAVSALRVLPFGWVRFFFSSSLLRNGGPRSLTSERVLIWTAVRLGPHSFCSSVPRTSPSSPRDSRHVASSRFFGRNERDWRQTDLSNWNLCQKHGGGCVSWWCWWWNMGSRMVEHVLSVLQNLRSTQRFSNEVYNNITIWQNIHNNCRLKELEIC